VHFQLSESLLSALRQRRDQNRLLRDKGRRGKPRSSAPSSPSLIENVKELFSTTEPDFEQSAQAYVDALSDLQDEVEEAYDAFLLDPGWGPMLYITTDGRVLADNRSVEGEEVCEATGNYAIMALVIGAKKTGITALLDLIPSQPADGQRCTTCDGRRWAELQPGVGNEWVCSLCGGRGWIAPTPT
jgi:hypothetical protein